MLNLQKLQNLSPFQSDSGLNGNAATAAALASLQGLAAGITASAAAAALNSPLNLTVSNNGGMGNSVSNDLLGCGPKSLLLGGHVPNDVTMRNLSGGGEGQKHNGSTPPSPTNDNHSGSVAAQNALANVLNNAAAAAAAAAGAASTASPPPQMPPPPASAQMPQLILASGQLVQGVQGAQLLIPTAQGKLFYTLFIISCRPRHQKINQCNNIICRYCCANHIDYTSESSNKYQRTVFGKFWRFSSIYIATKCGLISSGQWKCVDFIFSSATYTHRS